MELELATAAFENSHFDDAGFFKEMQPQRVIGDCSCVLNDSRHGAYNVNEVVSFVVDLVHFGASHAKLCSRALLNHVVYNFWMRLIADFKDVFPRNFLIKSARCRLQVV